MKRDLAQALWLASPVAVTGVVHMFIVRRDLLAPMAQPLDFGARLGGERLLGDNKTWRGVFVMIVGAALLGALQGLLGGRWAAAQGLPPVNFAAFGIAPGFTAASALVAGYAVVQAVLGLGYVLGELPNSFLKRRLGITPGKKGNGLIGSLFFALDQSDSVVAALGMALVCFALPFRVFAAGVVALTGVHLALTSALHVAGVKRDL